MPFTKRRCPRCQASTLRVLWTGDSHYVLIDGPLEVNTRAEVGTNTVVMEAVDHTRLGLCTPGGVVPCGE
jgi:hypothetical protein